MVLGPRIQHPKNSAKDGTLKKNLRLFLNLMLIIGWFHILFPRKKVWREWKRYKIAHWNKPTSGPTSYWLISDLIPKKSEKFEFRKNFVTIFFSVKNWPKKWNFDFFCPRNFEKIAKLSSKFQSGKFTWKMENFEKTHFASESA